MSNITSLLTESNRLDAALLVATQRAELAYPAEALRIRRGLGIAQMDGVVFVGSEAFVASESHIGIFYRVNGHCTCCDAKNAPSGRCKHRWAKALLRKAQELVEQMALDPAPGETHYATYSTPWGELQYGLATWEVTKWRFVPNDGGEPVYPDASTLVLGANVALHAAQKAHDGDLVKKVCGY